MRVTRTRSAVAALGLLAVIAAACSSGGTDAGSAATTTAPTAAAATTTTTPATTAATTTTSPPTTVPAPRYYLSLGDSYASGFQPKVGNTRDGFAYQVAAASQTSPHPLQLVNVGCAGATTSSLLGTKGCPARLPRPGRHPVSRPDAARSGRGLPAGPSRTGRPHHRVDRRERRDPVRHEPRRRHCVGDGDAEHQHEPPDDRAALARRRRRRRRSSSARPIPTSSSASGSAGPRTASSWPPCRSAPSSR